MDEVKCTDFLSLQCKFCKKEFDKPSILTSHLNSHKDLWRYTCDVCDESFPTLLSMATHKRGHKDHEFKCSVCSNTFNHYSNWRFHQKTHFMPQKVFKPIPKTFAEKTASKCDKLFSPTNAQKSLKKARFLRCQSSPALLSADICRENTQPLPDSFQCKKCPKSLSSRLALKVHCKSHSLERAHSLLKNLSPRKVSPKLQKEEKELSTPNKNK